MLFTASTDKTVRVWDMETGACVRKFRGHTNFVNSCHPARRGPQLVCSGSDDGTVKVSSASIFLLSLQHYLLLLVINQRLINIFFRFGTRAKERLLLLSLILIN